MSLLNRTKAWGRNTGEQIGFAWTKGIDGKGVGVRDVLMPGVGLGRWAKNALGTKGKTSADKVDGSAPAYEKPPSYVTEGTTVEAAQMADNSGAWQRMAEDKQRQEESMQMDKQGRLANSGLAQARSGLAMRGGLRGGAGERMAANATEANIMGNQMTLGQGSADRLGIGMKAQDMSMDIGKANAGFDQQARLANAGNAMNRETARNANAFGTYTELMKQKGADYAARLQSKASSKPTLLSDPLGYTRSQF